MRYAKFSMAALMVAGLLAMASASTAMGAEGDTSSSSSSSSSGKKPKLLHGIIKSVEGTKVTLTVGKGDNAKDVDVETDSSTQVTIDHKAASLTDLKPGEVAAVAPAEGKAEHIDVNTTHKSKKGGSSGGTSGGTGESGTGAAGSSETK